MRSCCPSNIREFNMEIKHVVAGTGQPVSKQFANAYKPLKCPCFCCNRPEIFVNIGDCIFLLCNSVIEFDLCKTLFFFFFAGIIFKFC